MPFPTETAEHELEEACATWLEEPRPLAANAPKHIQFLRMMLGIDKKLPPPFMRLDASHPWLVFWATNALSMLGGNLTAAELDRVGETLIACQHPSGGFGGGPGQPPHIACTYGAVMALSYCDEKYLQQIDRRKLYEWILRDLKNPESGGFRVSRHGEEDPRAAYCALAVTRLLNICTSKISAGVGEYLRSCQTYEGGFASTPFGEAHGGYTFCSLAALFLLNDRDVRKNLELYCSLKRLARWLVRRQNLRIGGFEGRTNKLVDGCYSHWVGGCWPLLDMAFGLSKSWPWDRNALKTYILRCCQSPNGGLRDKPGTSPDSYHTNYCLSGLSSTETSFEYNGSVFTITSTTHTSDTKLLNAINPVFGIDSRRVVKVHSFFLNKSAPRTREYQGFALYVGACFTLFLYLVWAFTPSRWLHFVHIDYYPSRWWAIAVPFYILFTMGYIYCALLLYNVEKLAFKPTSLATVGDRDSFVHDVPIVKANAMYAT